MDLPRKRAAIVAAGVVGIVLVFLAGYLPASARARRTAEQARLNARQASDANAALAQTRFDLEVARLRGRLGELLHEANANNFGVAAERASAFFDGVRATVASPHLAVGSERRAVLEAMLARRDEISADLARADPAVKGKLTEMYLQFGAAVP